MPAVTEPPKPIVRFGPFEADLNAGELRKHGVKLKLQDLPFRLLACLLECPGEVVTREELQAKLWPAGTFVDFERGIRTALNKLREVLCDSATEPRFIETIPRRGYRFIANIETASSTLEVAPQRPRLPRKHAVIAALAIVFFSGVVFLALRTRPAPLTDRDVLVLADFANSTSDPVFDGTLREALAFQLEESPFLKVLDDEVVRQDLQYMRRSPQERITNELAHDICVREAEKAMLSGSIASLGKNYAIELKATICQTGATLARQTAEAPDKEHVLAALGKAAEGMRAKLGESLASIQKSEPVDFQVTTGSLEAFEAFAAGEKLFFQSRFIEAIPVLQRATELDPYLGEAYDMLASSELNTGGGGNRQAAEEYAAKGYALRDHASLSERFRLTGLRRSNLDEALKNYELWASAYPREAAPFAQAEIIRTNRGEFEEALRLELQAYQLAPRRFFGTLLMNDYIRLDRFAEAKAVAEKDFGQGLAPWQDHQALLRIAWMQSDQRAAEEQVQWFIGKPEEFRNLELRASQARILGQLRQSRELLQKAAGLARRRDVPDAAARLLAPDAAGDALLGNCSAAHRASPASSNLGDRQTMLLAFCGDAAMMQSAVKRAGQLSKLHGDESLWNNAGLPQIRAAIAFRSGRPENAIELLRSVTPYERAYTFAVFLRGLAFLRLKKGAEAAAEFQKIVDHKGANWGPLYPLSYVGLAQSEALLGDTIRARKAYEEFFNLWKDADPEIPLLKQAKAEYAKLPEAP